MTGRARCAAQRTQGNLKAVQKLLGHSSGNIYTDWNIDRLAETLRAGWISCAWQESNLRPRAPEARALSPELQARAG